MDYDEDYDILLKYNEKYELKGLKKFNEGIKLEIDINSPLFEIFSKSKFFGELFVIPIYSHFIEEYKIEKDYINAFNILNDINSNYLSIFFQFSEAQDIKYLKDFNIAFNKIKNLKIRQQYYNTIDKEINYNLFFKDNSISAVIYIFSLLSIFKVFNVFIFNSNIFLALNPFNVKFSNILNLFKF